MEKIYISGQITGIEKEAPELFAKAERYLTDKGFKAVNPMTIVHAHDLSWTNYMKTDIIALMDCNAIYMLTNWTNSKGAEIERDIAIKLGYKIIYQTQ